MKSKLFYIILSVYFWALMRFPKVSAEWPMWKTAVVFSVGALVMFAVTMIFFSDNPEDKYDPMDYIWFNYPRPLDRNHWPREPGFYFWGLNRIHFYGPYSTHDEADYFFRKYLRSPNATAAKRQSSC